MSTLSREQVEVMLKGLIQDKVDGVNVARLLDHDAALRSCAAELESVLVEIASVQTEMPGWGKHCLELAKQQLADLRAERESQP